MVREAGGAVAERIQRSPPPTVLRNNGCCCVEPALCTVQLPQLRGLGVLAQVPARDRNANPHRADVALQL